MFQDRIKRLQIELPNFEIEALLVSSPYNIIYLTGISAFSLEEREAHILITKNSCVLFTDRRYTGHVKQVAPFVELLEINSENPFLKLLATNCQKNNVKHIGFEKENLSYVEFEDLSETLASCNVIPTENLLEDMRTIKDAYEQDALKKAAQLTDKAFTFIQTLLKEGVSEYQVEVDLEYFIKKNGGEVAFRPIVAFGKNSAIPHHHSGDTTLVKGNTVLLDFGAKVNGYCSDMTRTIFFGNATPEQKKMYQVTLEAQHMAIESLHELGKKDFVLSNVHNIATSHITSQNFPPIPHALGHGVGLQVHENPVISPYSEDTLQPGMVITIEPGIYIEEIGGVRIEDTILITETGPQILNSSSKELICI